MVDNMLKMEYISDEEILLNRGELNTDMASVDGLGNKHRYNTNKKVRN